VTDDSPSPYFRTCADGRGCHHRGGLLKEGAAAGTASAAASAAAGGSATAAAPATTSAATGGSAPRPLTEEEIFAKKTLAELNSERNVVDVYFDYDQSAIREDARAPCSATPTG
jgi:hypothetical protein